MELPVFNVRNCGLVHTKSSGKCCLNAPPTFCQRFTNLFNILSGELFSSAHGLCAYSSFLPSIGDVVFLRSEKEMAGINTTPIVASMQNEETIRNRTSGEHPRNSVCAHRLTSELALTVASSEKEAIPFPTRPWVATHFGEKSLTCRRLFGPSAYRTKQSGSFTVHEQILIQS